MPAVRHPDPAWRGRVIASLLLLVLLWPMLVYSEFQPWILFDKQSLQASWQFLASFVPPAHSVEFLKMVLHATWETVAIATAGLTLALLGAIPLTLLASESLSISRLESGEKWTATHSPAASKGSRPAMPASVPLWRSATVFQVACSTILRNSTEWHETTRNCQLACRLA